VTTIKILERATTQAMLERMVTGFTENAVQPGNLFHPSEQYSFVAQDGDTFIGCATGWVYKHNDAYNGWTYLAELYLEKPYRRQGLGATLLSLVEERVAGLGITKMYTETAGYEAPGFYTRQGYQIICELENRYVSGHPQVVLRKTLPLPPSPTEYAGEIRITERLMTDVEFARMNDGFNEHAIEHGNPAGTGIRYEVIALDGETFIGCMSGLAYHHWFFITDVVIEKVYHTKDVETTLLHAMEESAAAHGLRYIWRWTTCADELGLYQQQVSPLTLCVPSLLTCSDHPS